MRVLADIRQNWPEVLFPFPLFPDFPGAETEF